MTRPMRKAFFSQPAAPKLYVDDVFSAYTYTGNGGTQTINNGIDLAGKGGMVWVAARSSAFGHYLFDTVRGLPNRVSTHNTNAQASITPAFVSSFNSNGFSTQSDIASTGLQTSGLSGVSWTFRKAPKFFDVVTYTGNGVAGRQIAHSLGVAPGMIIVKRVNNSSQWSVYHRSITAANCLYLSQTDASSAAPGTWDNTEPTSSSFTVGISANTNNSGDTYVAYLFAHDPSADGLIQCGSFTSSTGDVSVNLGWEPQYVLFKKTNGASDWVVLDQSRGLCVDKDSTLNPNNANSETSAFSVLDPTSTGFVAKGAWFGEAAPYIYLAIRRPNKPPTSGTQVYNAIAYAGDNASGRNISGVGFSPDLSLWNSRGGGLGGFQWIDRLRGVTKDLLSAETSQEYTNSYFSSIDSDGVTLGSYGTGGQNSGGFNYINNFFRRAPGFFDVVCYTGASGGRTVPHNLGAAPEFMIVKCRNTSARWAVYSATIGPSKYLNLHLTDAANGTINWNDANPTASVFSLGGGVTVNDVGYTYVAYLFATLPGISKVGSYTGNGASQTINCGFATGARFVLIKRTDAAGDWYVWDSVRGIVAANDPHLSLNTTAAEVTTDDSVDPEASGFIVNQVAATNINVSGASYIFLAIA